MVLESCQFVAGLGHIPNDWRIKTADEISLKITKGTTPPKEDIVERREIPFLRVNNLGFHGDLDQKSDFIFVSRNAHEGFLARSKAYPGDILMNIVGPPLGKVSLLGNDFAEYNMNQAIVIYRLQDDVICRNYFLAYLLSDIAQQWLQSRSKKTSGQQNLTIELCKGLPVPIPAFVEQKKIAQILSTWDQAIATTERLLDLARQQKKALMQQLLTGKKRFSGFEGEWKYIQFGKVFKERVETGRDDLPLLSITAEDGVVYQDETGRKDTSNEDKSKYRRICVDDIGYNTMRMWQGRSSLSDKEGIVSPAYTIVTPSSEINPRFAAYLFKLPELVHVFYRHSQGLVSDTWNLKFSHFAKIKWAIPGLDEQRKIAAVLLTNDQEIETLQSQLDALKQEKKALMQTLLTGKRRVQID